MRIFCNDFLQNNALFSLSTSLLYSTVIRSVNSHVYFLCYRVLKQKFLDWVNFSIYVKVLSRSQTSVQYWVERQTNLNIKEGKQNQMKTATQRLYVSSWQTYSLTKYFAQHPSPPMHTGKTWFSIRHCDAITVSGTILLGLYYDLPGLCIISVFTLPGLCIIPVFTLLGLCNISVFTLPGLCIINYQCSHCLDFVSYQCSHCLNCGEHSFAGILLTQTSVESWMVFDQKDNICIMSWDPGPKGQHINRNLV